MLGEVVIIPDEEMGELMGKVSGALNGIRLASKILVPPSPIPRYLFGRGYGSATHCTNEGEDDYRQTILSGHQRVRKKMISSLGKTRIYEARVVDFVRVFTESHKLAERKLGKLREIYHRDSVHLTNEGYKHLAAEIVRIAKVQRTEANKNRRDRAP